MLITYCLASALLILFESPAIFAVIDNFPVLISQNASIGNFPCINSIYKEHFSKLLVYSVNFNGISLYPVIHFNPSEENFHLFIRREKPDGYVIEIDEESFFYFTIEKLNKWPTFNPKAKFLLLMKEKSQLLIHILYTYYIYNAVIFQAGNLYIIKGYEFIDIGICNNTSTLPTNIFNYTEKNNFKNYPLKIIYNKLPPASMCPRCTNEKGIEIDLANMIFEHMELNYIYEATKRTYWGDKTNQTYSDLYGLLQQRETNALIGFFHTKSEEHYYFDQSFTYIQPSLGFIVPRAKKIPPWLRIAYILPLSVWIVYWVQFFLVGMIMLSLNRIRKIREHLNLNKIYIYLYQVVIESASKYHPRTTAFKFIAIFWLLQILIFNTALRSNLLAILIRNEYEDQIRTFHDIAHSNLKITLDPFLRNQFAESTNPAEVLIYQKATEECDISTTCMRLTAVNGDRAMIFFKLVSEYHSFRILCNEAGELLVYAIKEPVNVLDVQVYFEKGHPIFPIFNYYLLSLWETGHVVQRFRIIRRKYVIAKGLADAAKTRLDTQPLNLLQLLGIFALWAIGILISCILFVIEIWHK